jgi:flagellar protein FlaF
MSFQAYQKAANKTSNPRDVEYRLFAQVTHALSEAKTLEKHEFRKLIDTLDWNRRVWSALAMDCSNPDNGLPVQTRASIISLSIYVSKQSSAIVRGQGDLDDLIEINRTIMQGLAGQP